MKNKQSIFLVSAFLIYINNKNNGCCSVNQSLQVKDGINLVFIQLYFIKMYLMVAMLFLMITGDKMT